MDITNLAEINAEFVAGAPLRQLANKYNTTRELLYRRFKSAGLPTASVAAHRAASRKRLTKEQKQAIIDYAASTRLPALTIADHFNVSPGLVSRLTGRSGKTKLSESADRLNLETGERRCITCNTWKTKDSFFTNKHGSYLPSCKLCMMDRVRQRRYKISKTDYETLLAKQSGRCAICNETASSARNGGRSVLSVDHNHANGAVRGLLCDRCNAGLGHSRESAEYLKAASVYLLNSRDIRQLPSQGRYHVAQPVCDTGKVCPNCNIKLSEESFYSDARTKGKLTWACKSCLEILRRKWKYSISQDQYEAQLATQGNCCPICKDTPSAERVRGKTFVVDHCHTTGAVRGILCNRCNHFIGDFSDNPAFLASAVQYLSTPIDNATDNAIL